MSSSFQPILKNTLFIFVGEMVWIIMNEFVRVMVIQNQSNFPVFMEPFVNDLWPLIPVIIIIPFLIRMYIENQRRSAEGAL